MLTSGADCVPKAAVNNQANENRRAASEGDAERHGAHEGRRTAGLV